MGKMKKTLAIILSMLMAVQTPAMAGELFVEEETPVAEEIPAEEDVVIEEELSEVVTEEPVEEESLGGELLEEPEEDSLIPGDSFEEELVEEPIEAITEELPAEQIDAVPSEEEGIIEEDEPALVGESSGQCGDNVYWTLSNEGVLTISGTGEMYDYGYDSSPWYSWKSEIKSVIIESGVTSIGDWAFHSCSSLTSVTIPDSVTSIGDYAFSDCSSLTNVTIPDSVTSIGDSVFYYCSALTSVTIPDSVTSIGNGAFDSCTSLTNVAIPDSVTSIGDWAFSDCSSLTNVTIPDSVTSIGEGAFNECSSLTSVTIGDSVTWIGNSVFGGCSSLTNVTIGDNVTSIGKYAFYWCTSLTSVTIPDSVTSIGNSVFGGCTSLNTITFEGDAPKFDYNSDYHDESSAFADVTATAYYPSDNPTWTADVRKNYGGNITWIPLRSNGTPAFTDVTDPTLFYYDPIYWAVDNGIATGYNDNTFRPYNNCNRAAVVTFLWRLAGKPDMGITNAFSDMTGNDDFDHAITWAAAKGITTGYNDDTFRPWDTCHRAAIVTFLWRYAGKPKPKSIAKFKDMTGNDDFNKAISWASEKGITTGYTDGTFRPWNQCLRLAVATFLYRYAHL